MPSGKPGSIQGIRISPSRIKPDWLECPDRSRTTVRCARRKRRSDFGTGLTRSIPAGRFSGVDGLRSRSKRRGFWSGGIASGARCGRWESRGSILGPTLARGLWNTRSIPISFAMSQPSTRTISGGSTSPIFDCKRDGCISCHHRLVFPFCRLLGALSDPGDAICPGGGGSSLFDRFSGHFQQ